MAVPLCDISATPTAESPPHSHTAGTRHQGVTDAGHCLNLRDGVPVRDAEPLTTTSASAPQLARRDAVAPRSAGVWDGEARGTSTRSTGRPVVSLTSCGAGRPVGSLPQASAADRGASLQRMKGRSVVCRRPCCGVDRAAWDCHGWGRL